jgi:hypothetical protein
MKNKKHTVNQRLSILEKITGMLYVQVKELESKQEPKQEPKK